MWTWLPRGSSPGDDISLVDWETCIDTASLALNITHSEAAPTAVRREEKSTVFLTNRFFENELTLQAVLLQCYNFRIPINESAHECM